MNATGFIVGGKVVPCALPVYNWHDHGLEFRPGDGARKVNPKVVVDLAVWHWTGGEGDYDDVYRVLDQRDLGVELFINRGKIYQYCDPLLVDAFAAGPYNPRSLSVEVANYGFRKDMSKVPRGWAGKRETYTTIQNGRRREFARYFQEDLVACAALAAAISDAIPTIPRTVPVKADGTLYPNYLPPWKMKKVTGHVGHYHLSTRKSDPGADLLTYLMTSGTCTGQLVSP